MALFQHNSLMKIGINSLHRSGFLCRASEWGSGAPILEISIWTLHHASKVINTAKGFRLKMIYLQEDSPWQTNSQSFKSQLTLHLLRDGMNSPLWDATKLDLDSFSYFISVFPIVFDTLNTIEREKVITLNLHQNETKWRGRDLISLMLAIKLMLLHLGRLLERQSTIFKLRSPWKLNFCKRFLLSE